MTFLGISLSDVKMVPIKLKSKLINQPQASALSIFFHQQYFKHKEGFMLLSRLQLFETPWTV